VNAGRQPREVPLLAQMTILLKVAVWAAAPASLPVAALKVAHHGLLVIEKVSLAPEESFAVG
jgi:hypothetical protein